MNTQFTFEEIVNIVREWPEADKERLRKELLPKDLLESFVSEVYSKYETVFKGLTI